MQIKNNERKIGDKNTHGMKNIPFFWSPQRLFLENIFHAIATSLFILCGIILLFFIIFSSIHDNIDFLKYGQPAMWQQILLWIIALFLFGGIACKLEERQQRKKRLESIKKY